MLCTASEYFLLNSWSSDHLWRRKKHFSVTPGRRLCCQFRSRRNSISRQTRAQKKLWTFDLSRRDLAFPWDASEKKSSPDKRSTQEFATSCFHLSSLVLILLIVSLHVREINWGAKHQSNFDILFEKYLLNKFQESHQQVTLREVPLYEELLWGD